MRIGLFSVVDGHAELGRTTGELYEDLLKQVELAEELGFDSFWIAEHHFHEYGMVPRAAIWLAAAAQRTRRIRLGAAVVVLPFDNPLRTAEDYAMVDVLSGGRLNIGVGSGYLKHEFAGFSQSMEEKRERFDEGLDILLRAWSGKRFSYEGKFNSCRDVILNVVPLQKPRPPVAVAILNAGAAEHVGARGFNLMLIPYATTDDIGQLAEIASAFNRGIAGSAHSSHEEQEKRIYFALHAYCANDGGAAREQVKPYLERYVRTRLYARQRSFQELTERKLVAFGDAPDVAAILAEYETAGLTDFLAITNFGGIPHEDACRTMRVLSKLNGSSSPARQTFSSVGD